MGSKKKNQNQQQFLPSDGDQASEAVGRIAWVFVSSLIDTKVVLSCGTLDEDAEDEAESG